jgi:hypothetical protein
MWNLIVLQLIESMWSTNGSESNFDKSEYCLFALFIDNGSSVFAFSFFDLEPLFNKIKSKYEAKIYNKLTVKHYYEIVLAHSNYL